MRASAVTLVALIASCGSDPCEEGAPATLCELAGTGIIGFNGDGLSALETHLGLLSSVRRGPDGRIYIMDFNNFRLRVIERDGTVTTLAGNGEHGFATTDGPAIQSPLENPIDFDFLPDGRIVFVSYHDPRVLMLDGGMLRPLAGTGSVADFGDGGPALEAGFIQLDGIAVRPDGAIYVSDSKAERVRLIENGMIRTVAGTGETGYSGDGGPGTEAQLSWPTALALDSAGNLYFTEKVNGVLRRLDPDGIISTVAGPEAMFKWPDGIAIDEDGTMYVSDGANFRVRRISADGAIDTIAGNGTQGVEGVGGPGLQAQFGYLSRVYLDGASLLIADQSNSFARRFHLP